MCACARAGTCVHMGQHNYMCFLQGPGPMRPPFFVRYERKVCTVYRTNFGEEKQEI